ncbi:MAG TPA: guanylate kinase [Candidatus Cryosericum sp.]|nr:guanylate kinase [Candidatus Cryosericum sp.]
MSDALAEGSVIVVSAPSGSGKTTLCRRLLDDVPGLEFSVSHTTRPPRPGEQDGRDYHFVSGEEFERRRAAGEFIEWARVADHLYGTSGDVVRRTVARGSDVLLDVDTQGAAAIRRAIPESVLVFILPPGRQDLKARLEGRGSETKESLQRRLDLAKAEIEKAGLYDYLIVNDDLEAAYERLRAVVLASRSRLGRQKRRLQEILSRF